MIIFVLTVDPAAAAVYTTTASFPIPIFRSGTDLMHLVSVVLVRATSSKSIKLCRFELDWYKIWQDYSSSKYASIG